MIALTVDNRNLVDMESYRLSQIEVLKRRIAELENDVDYLNYVICQRDQMIESLAGGQ